MKAGIMQLINTCENKNLLKQINLYNMYFYTQHKAHNKKCKYIKNYNKNINMYKNNKYKFNCKKC